MNKKLLLPLFLGVLFSTAHPSDVPMEPSFDLLHEGQRILHFSYPDGWRDEPTAALIMKSYFITLSDTPDYLAHAQYLVAKKMWDNLPESLMLWDVAGIKWIPLCILIKLLRAASAGGEKKATEMLLEIDGAGFTHEPMPSSAEMMQISTDFTATQGG